MLVKQKAKRNKEAERKQLKDIACITTPNYLSYQLEPALKRRLLLLQHKYDVLTCATTTFAGGRVN